MDDYLKLLRCPGQFQTKIVPTGTCHGRINVPKDSDSSDDEEPTLTGIEYVKELEAKEMALYEDSLLNENRVGTLSCVETVGELIEDPTITRSQVVERVYGEYTFIKSSRPHLPIDNKKNDILSMLRVTNVIIIQGDTGCGKTTQVPQFILDEYKEKNEYCNIVVTQPRKIAATSVTERVCEERGWQVGTICGYQIGLDRKTNNDTILTYMTAGVLLQKLISRKNLNEFTHIIIDEVHERTQEIDFLLILLRRFMNTNSLTVKIILMSATFDTEKFAYYFKNVAGGLNLPAARIDVCKEHIFDKSIHYIEELSNLGEIPDNQDYHSVAISSAVYNIFVQLVLALKHIDDDDDIGHVLVFLPGIYEIEVAYSLLMNENKKGGETFMVVPLHSSIPSKEQNRAFNKPGPGVRKIILSTNIAESSITVPDIVYVIDFCMTKMMVVDPITQYQSLQLTWASKTNCIQRAGRVGRVRSGRVYRLVWRDFYEYDIPNDIPPEMLRAPLERVVLFSKKLELVELPQSILGLAINPPDLKNITATIKNLKEAGALLPTCRGQFIAADGDLTMLGTVMCALPIDVKLSKMICLGYMFSCFDDCVIIAAGCSLPNIFSTPFQERMRSYVNKLIWADGTCSDLLAHLSLYTIFDKNLSTGVFANNRDEKCWCEKNYLSHRSMTEWRILVKEIKDRLANIHVSEERGPSHVSMNPVEKQLVLKVIIAGAFYPNYFARSCDGGQVDEKEVFKYLKGLNPHQTVYFSNMDKEQPGPLYEQRIKEIMKPISSDINVYFDTTSKIYIAFNDVRQPYKTEIAGRKLIATMPGKIAVDVYKAIRMRQLNMNTTFPAMPVSQAWLLAERLQLATDHGGYYSLIKCNDTKKTTIGSVIPALKIKNMAVRISHVIDAGHFYAQPSHQQCSNILEIILNSLNSDENPLEIVNKDEIKIGGLYASRFTDDNNFYRCRVIGITPFMKNETRVQIIYIDYGNTENVPPNMLYEIPMTQAKTMPPQAMECVLRGVQPTVVFNPRGTWSEDATTFFYEQTKDVELIAQIYSVVEDIVSMDLYRLHGQVSINKMLIDRHFGERHEESYMSKENNEIRIAAIQSSMEYETVELNATNPRCPLRHVDSPADSVCRSSIHLRGPFSPLEMRVYPMNKSTEDVKIDSSSVNTVLLDADPQDPHERLLVATYVSKSQHTSCLTLRHTTLMPNIHGFPALMALIFCPVMKMKASHDGTTYVSILCGLGEDARRKPIYSEHDIKVVLDVEITVADLKLINDIRFCMNKLVEIMQMYYDNAQVQQHRYHRELKDRLMQLLKIQRESQERQIVEHSDSWSKAVFHGVVLNPAGGAFKKDEDVWPLHSTIELINKNDENVLLKRHIDELSEMARKYIVMDTIKCLFCEVEIVTIDELRLHLVTTVHKANINRFHANHS